MAPIIRKAEPEDTGAVTAVLADAAAWLEAKGAPLWLPNEIGEDDVTRDLRVYWMAEVGGEPAGVLKFQLEDPMCWPDISWEDSAFVHRLAVRRKFAGGAVAGAMLSWALAQTQKLGRSYLRLDCDAARPRLRQVYERFGFSWHSNLVVRDAQGAVRLTIARYEYPAERAARN